MSDKFTKELFTIVIEEPLTKAETEPKTESVTNSESQKKDQINEILNI